MRRSLFPNLTNLVSLYINISYIYPTHIYFYTLPIHIQTTICTLTDTPTYILYITDFLVRRSVGA